jgi:hypothetical protein
MKTLPYEAKLPGVRDSRPKEALRTSRGTISASDGASK